MIDLVDVVRLITVASLAVGAGASLRAMISARHHGLVPRSIWWIAAGGLLMSCGGAATIANNLHQHWIWSETPLFLFGSLAWLIGSFQVVKIRKP